MPPVHPRASPGSSQRGRGWGGRRQNKRPYNSSSSRTQATPRRTQGSRPRTSRPLESPRNSVHSPHSRHIPTSSRPSSAIPPGDTRTPVNEEDGDEHDTIDAVQHEIIMAIDIREKSTIGCAYFSTLDGTLYLSEDIPMANTDIAEQFLAHVQPSTLLVSARAQEEFYKFLEHKCLASSGATAQDILFRSLQSSDFLFDSAHERILNLQSNAAPPAQLVFSTSLESDPLGEATSQSDGPSGQESRIFRSLRFGSSINLKNTVSVGSAGAVLSDIHRRQSYGFLPDGQVSGVLFRVRSIEMFSLSNFMFVSPDALLSLQIVQTELHPNSQVWGSDPSKGNSKESLSVYGLFHHLACTPQGRTQLRQLLLHPVLDVQLIEERQRSISTLLQPDNAETLTRITSCLRKVRNIRSSLAQLRKGVEFSSSCQSFNRGVWSTLQNFTVQTLGLRGVIASLNNGADLQIISKLLENLPTATLLSVGGLINRTIDFNESKAQHRTSVKTGIDPQLDELKRAYNGMDNFLTRAVYHMRNELPEWACQYIRSCIFLPQIGFLTVVEPNPNTGNGRYEGEGVEGGTWEKMFTVDGAVCYKNNFMRELDNEYGDMYCQIGDREVEIIHNLASQVLEHEEALMSASDVCGEFDAILSLALGAQKYGWKAPRVIEASIIHIEAGRHPLQELVVPAFIPNDCDIASGAPEGRQDEGIPPQALVLTGPNHSGKSVYLKQVAVIVYLAHIGSFVPADRATIGLTDRMLTCISARESMSGAESAFAADLKQAALSLRYSTFKSLILVDEFGKGTNADDGSGLLAALLDHFLSRGQDSPRLLVATHYHEVFEGKYLDEHESLRLAHLDVRVDWKASQVEDQVTYLFSLKYGHSTSSFGGKCAALNGVPMEVVDRAEAISTLLARNEDLKTFCSRLSPEEEKKLSQAEGTARRFLEHDFERLGDDQVEHGGRFFVNLLEDILSNKAT